MLTLFLQSVFNFFMKTHFFIWSHLRCVYIGFCSPVSRHQEASTEHPGGTQEAPRGTQGTQEAPGGLGGKKLCPSQLKCKSFPKMLILLRVFEGRITKYCKFSKRLVAGSLQRSGGPAKAPYQDRENPFSVNTVWGISSFPSKSKTKHIV